MKISITLDLPDELTMAQVKAAFDHCLLDLAQYQGPELKVDEEIQLYADSVSSAVIFRSE